jgi:prepilin-type N-terminal cleavage/methylation domain-containing protein
VGINLMIKKYTTQQPTQRGFTIVELLIVIVVIGILAAITFVAFNGIQNRAQQARYDQTAQSILKKIEVYKSLVGTYPVFPDATFTDLYTGQPGAPLEVQLPTNLQIFYTSNYGTVSYNDVKDAADGKYSGAPKPTYIGYICSGNNGYQLLKPNVINSTITTLTTGSC